MTSTNIVRIVILTSLWGLFSSGTNGLASAFSIVTKPSAGTTRRLHSLLGRNERVDDDSGQSNGPMPILPTNLVKYSQVPKEGAVFTETTIPKGLLNKHSTKAETWGVIKILKGSLQYTLAPRRSDKDCTYENGEIHEQKDQAAKFLLFPGFDGIIEPERLHHVASVDGEGVEFVVEFHRVPGTGPVDERRD
eukprot:jgi/Psemu1/308862/fgenesh1_kg.451_\